MTVSIAVLELPRNIDRVCSIEDAGNIIALLKKKAKRSEHGISNACIMEFLDLKTETKNKFSIAPAFETSGEYKLKLNPAPGF